MARGKPAGSKRGQGVKGARMSDIGIDISDDERLELVRIWVKDNLTPESASVYEDTMDVEQAIFNEAVINILREQMAREKC